MMSFLRTGPESLCGAPLVAPHMGWCNQVSVVLKNNVQLQEFNKAISGVQWRNITSIFVLMILAKLSGMKLIHDAVWP